MAEKGGFASVFSFGKGSKLTIVVLLFTVIYCVAVLGGSSYFASRKDSSARPQSMLPILKRDLALFHQKFGRFPANLNELELQIWNSGKTPAKSLFDDPNTHDYYYQNVTYKYYSDSQVFGLWIIPKGEFRKDFNTIFLLVANTKDGYIEKVWKGAYLEPEGEKLIPARAIPGASELATLGMSLQYGTNAPSPPKKGGFSDFFKF